jgi:hypothetical protein
LRQNPVDISSVATTLALASHFKNAGFMPGSRMTIGLESTGKPLRRDRSLRYRQSIAVLLPFGGYESLHFCRTDPWEAEP